MTAQPDQNTAPAAVDADRAADMAALDGLLRCWVRENRVPVPDGGVLTLDLPVADTRLLADVVYRSATGHHRFADVRLDNGTPVTAVTAAALLTVQAAGRDAHPNTVTDLVGRVADSETRVARHIRHRTLRPQDPAGTTPFLAAEQALILGHPLHPTPKSRLGISDSEAIELSPEFRGSFQPHWFAADASVVSSDGGVSGLLAEFAPSVPAGMVPVPAHPWQAREVRSRPEVRRLLDEGLLRDLGRSGEPWFPTASIRTVYRPDAPVMLKFSLGLPITNSKRENLRKELRRGVEINELLEAGLGSELAAAYPDFGIVRDPAWLAVDAGDTVDAGSGLEGAAGRGDERDG